MKYVFVPYVSVGPVRLMMTRQQLRNAVGKKPIEFMKTRKSPSRSDDFGDFHVHYDSQDRAEAVELFPGTIDMEFDGQSLFELSLNELQDLLHRMDPDLILESDGFTSKVCGIAVYAPGWKEGHGATAGSIVVFRNGYYDEP